MPTAIITGATQGIGRAISEKLLSQGFDIAICARTKQDLDSVKSEWEEKYNGCKVYIQTVDLAEKQQVLDFAHNALVQLGSVDLLVNNAGLFYPGKLVDEADGHLEWLMQVNMFSAYHLTRAILPSMKKVQAGHIFNICSVASLKAYPNGGSYSITKFALLGFSENLRLELIEDNIKVTALCPGATYSRSWEGADIDPDRIMKPEDVSEMLWAGYTLSKNANVETIVMRPAKGDL